MAKLLKTRIQLRRDSSANWANSNPVILDGEKILVDFYESGTYKYSREKVGDGVKTYNQLPFMDEGSGYNKAHPISHTDDGVVILETSVTSDGGHHIEASHVDYFDTDRTAVHTDSSGFFTAPNLAITEEGHISEITSFAINHVGDGTILVNEKHVTGNNKGPSHDIVVEHENMYGATYRKKYLFAGHNDDPVNTDTALLRVALHDVKISGYDSYSFVSYANGDELVYDTMLYLSIDGEEYSSNLKNYQSQNKWAEFVDGIYIENVDAGTLVINNERYNGKTFSLYIKEEMSNPVYNTTNRSDITLSANDEQSIFSIPTIKIDETGHVLAASSYNVTLDLKETRIETDDRPSINVYTNDPPFGGVTKVLIEHGDMFGVDAYREYISAYSEDSGDVFVVKNYTIRQGESITPHGGYPSLDQLCAEIDGTEYSAVQDEDGFIRFGDNFYLDGSCFGTYDENDHIISIYKKLHIEPVYSQTTPADDAKDTTIDANRPSFIIPQFSVESNGHVIKAENIEYTIEFPDPPSPEKYITVTTSDDKPSISVDASVIDDDHKLNIEIEHGNMFGMDSGWTSKYTSSNTTTSIGPGETKTIKIPQFTVETDGHIVKAEDEEISIEIPSEVNYDAVDYLGIINIQDSEDLTANREHLAQALQGAKDDGAKNGDFFRVHSGGTVYGLSGDEIVVIHSGDLIIANGDPVYPYVTEYLDPPTAEGYWSVIHCHNTDTLSSGITTKLSLSDNSSIVHEEVTSADEVISTNEIFLTGNNHISVLTDNATNAIIISDTISDLTSDEIKSIITSKFGVSV